MPRKLNRYLQDFKPGLVAQANFDGTELVGTPQLMVLQGLDENDSYTGQFHFDVGSPLKTQLGVSGAGTIIDTQFGFNETHKAGIVYWFGDAFGVFNDSSLPDIPSYGNVPTSQAISGVTTMEEKAKILYNGEFNHVVFKSSAVYSNIDDAIGTTFASGGNSLFFEGGVDGWNARIQAGITDFNSPSPRYAVGTGLYFWSSSADPRGGAKPSPAEPFNNGAFMWATSNYQYETGRNKFPSVFRGGIGMYGNMVVGDSFTGVDNLLTDPATSIAAPRFKLSDHGFFNYSDWPQPLVFNDNEHIRYLVSINNWFSDGVNTTGTFHLTPYGEVVMGVAEVAPDGQQHGLSLWYQNPTNTPDSVTPPEGMPGFYYQSDPSRHTAYTAVFSTGQFEEDADFKFTTDGKLNMRANGANPADAYIDVNLKFDTPSSSDKGFRIHDNGADVFSIRTNGDIHSGGNYNPGLGGSGWTAMAGTATRVPAAGTSTITTQQLAEVVKALIDDLIAKGVVNT